MNLIIQIYSIKYDENGKGPKNLIILTNNTEPALTVKIVRIESLLTSQVIIIQEIIHYFTFPLEVNGERIPKNYLGHYPTGF